MTRRIKKHPLDDGMLTWQRITTGSYISYQGLSIHHYFSIARRFDGRWRLFRNTYGYIGDFTTLKKAKAAAQYLQDNCMLGLG